MLDYYPFLFLISQGLLVDYIPLKTFGNPSVGFSLLLSKASSIKIFVILNCNSVLIHSSRLS